MNDKQLKVGQKAPDFTLKDTDGNTVRLSDFKGKKVILYFYPKDNTPGCTIEACNFRDDFSKYKSLGIEVLGISPDDEKSHKKFVTKYNLPFTLLCDRDAKVSKKYGVYRQKSFLGKKFMGINRTTFLIDEHGKILKMFDKVKVKIHSKEILALMENDKDPYEEALDTLKSYDEGHPPRTPHDYEV